MSASRKELEKLRQEEVYQPVYCSDEETEMFKMLLRDKQPLPEAIYLYEGKFYRYIDPDLSEKELSELLLLRQNKYLKSMEESGLKQEEHLRSISGGVTFFVFVAIISLVFGFIGLFSGG